MSEQEMNSYRFNSGQEPSEEMLAQIMREVAEEAREKISGYRFPVDFVLLNNFRINLNINEILKEC